MIVPSRLTLARRLRGQTGKAVAEAVGVSAGRISQLERGAGSPASAALVQALSRALGVPLNFLTHGEEVDFNDDEARYHYRHRARTPAWLRHQVESQSKLFTEFTNLLTQYFPSMPEPNVPKHPRGIEMSHEEALQFAERTALRVRRDWGLGDGPIPDLIALLEAHGVWVHILREESERIDAFSYWSSGGQPHIVLTTTEDTARNRLNAAHEVGHLVAHDGLKTGSRETEQEAFRFGAAFLLPAASWRQEAAPLTTHWRDYCHLTARWGVSIAAMFRRSLDLKILTPGQYRTAMVRYSSDGLRKEEPKYRGLLPAEIPTRLSKYLAALTQAGVTTEDLATQLSFPSDVLRTLIGPGTPKRGQVIQFRSREDKLVSALGRRPALLADE